MYLKTFKIDSAHRKSLANFVHGKNGIHKSHKCNEKILASLKNR